MGTVTKGKGLRSIRSWVAKLASERATECFPSPTSVRTRILKNLAIIVLPQGLLERKFLTFIFLCRCMGMAAYSTFALDIFHFCFWLVGMTPNRTGYNQPWLACSKSPIAKPEPYPNLAALRYRRIHSDFSSPHQKRSSLISIGPWSRQASRETSHILKRAADAFSRNVDFSLHPCHKCCFSCGLCSAQRRRRPCRRCRGKCTAPTGLNEHDGGSSLDSDTGNSLLLSSSAFSLLRRKLFSGSREMESRIVLGLTLDKCAIKEDWSLNYLPNRRNFEEFDFHLGDGRDTYLRNSRPPAPNPFPPPPRPRSVPEICPLLLLKLSSSSSENPRC